MLQNLKKKLLFDILLPVLPVQSSVILQFLDTTTFYVQYEDWHILSDVSSAVPGEKT
jgi:hypothetical protein